MKILISGNQCWVVNTSEQLEAAQRQLFNQFDSQGLYDTDHECIVHMLGLARDGDIRYIRAILDRHRDYASEGWDIVDAVFPGANISTPIKRIYELATKLWYRFIPDGSHPGVQGPSGKPDSWDMTTGILAGAITTLEQILQYTGGD